MKENKWSAFFKSMTSLRRRNGHEKFSNLNFISNIGRDESINPMKRNSTTWWASLRRTASKVGGRGDEDKGGVLFMALERCVVVMATTISKDFFWLLSIPTAFTLHISNMKLLIFIRITIYVINHLVSIAKWSASIFFKWKLKNFIRLQS